MLLLLLLMMMMMMMMMMICVEKPIQSVHITSPFIRYQPPLTESSVSDKYV